MPLPPLSVARGGRSSWVRGKPTFARRVVSLPPRAFAARTAPLLVPLTSTCGVWDRARRFAADLHATWLAACHRVSTSPFAVLVASFSAYVALDGGEGDAFVDVEAFRSLLPADLSEAAQDFLADPESGAHQLGALLLLGQLQSTARRLRGAVELPETNLDSAQAARSAVAYGVAALGSDAYRTAAHHFRQLAAIETKRASAPDVIADAYALLALAQVQAGDRRGARAAQRQWERLQRQAGRHPSGARWHRTRRARATMLAAAAARLATDDIGGDRTRRLVAAQAAYQLALADFRRVSDAAAVARVTANVAVLQEQLAVLAKPPEQEEPITAPDASTQDDLVREAALIRPVVAGPAGEAAVAMVQFFLLRHCTVADRDEALARWESHCFALYPAVAEEAQSVAYKYRRDFNAAYLCELLCYGLIPQALRPYMNAAVEAHAELLRVLHETIEASPRLSCADGDAAALLIRMAAMLRLIDATLQYYVRSGYRAGVERLEHLQAPLHARYLDLSHQLGLQAYRASQQPDAAAFTALVAPWVTAYVILHPADAPLRHALSPLRQAMFDRALLAEQMGNHLRMSPEVDTLREAYRALRLAHTGFTHLKLEARAARLDPLLRGLEHELTLAGAKDALGAKASGVRQRARPGEAEPRGDFKRAARDLVEEALRGPQNRKPE